MDKNNKNTAVLDNLMQYNIRVTAAADPLNEDSEDYE